MTTRDDDMPTTGDPAVVPSDTEAKEMKRFMRPDDTRPTPAEARAESEKGALFPHDAAHQLKSEWMSIQSKFVDEPRKSVEDADRLVASTLNRLAETFTSQRESLEQQRARGGDETEELRMAFQRYRALFDRVLSI